MSALQSDATTANISGGDPLIGSVVDAFPGRRKNTPPKSPFGFASV